MEQWQEHPVTLEVLSALNRHAKAIRSEVDASFWASGAISAEARLKVLMFEEVINEIEDATAEQINTYLEQADE